MNHKYNRRSISKKQKKSGFLNLMKTKNGCQIIKKRRKKGRTVL